MPDRKHPISEQEGYEALLCLQELAKKNNDVRLWIEVFSDGSGAIATLTRNTNMHNEITSTGTGADVIEAIIDVLGKA